MSLRSRWYIACVLGSIIITTCFHVYASVLRVYSGLSAFTFTSAQVVKYIVGKFQNIIVCFYVRASILWAYFGSSSFANTLARSIVGVFKIIRACFTSVDDCIAFYCACLL